ncbi:MAG: UvrD-helicase domain-containing protein, partial [Burkholderiaceae bacterium]
MTAPAYLADGVPVDRASFYAVACDPQRSVVVEACAGAGKTWMLVSRILRALLDGTRPHEILAITFTRKAAGEMRQRLDDWLREYARLQSSHADRVQALRERGLGAGEAERLAPRLAMLFDEVLEGGRPVEVRTFHAWFAQLLRGAPLELLAELGLQPEVELIEDVQEHRFDVFRRFHAALLVDPTARADLRDLIARRGRSQTRKWLEAAWEKRIEIELADAAGVLATSVEPATPDGSDPAAALQSTAWRERLQLLAIELGRGGAKAQDCATGLVGAIAQTGVRERFDRSWDALFTGDDTPRKQLGKTAPSLSGVQADLRDLRDRVDQHDACIEHAAMTRLARVLLREYAAYKRQRGLADMDDLERCALALLRDATLSGWVQERLDARIGQVLIDEFQDTSPLQWHALHAWLAAYAGAGGGTSGQRPPGVFIVGDPKQSIYRFRRAEPRVFDAAQRFVARSLGGVRLACDHTRRNPPELLATVNAVFASASHAGGFAGFRPHTTELGATTGAGVWTLAKVRRGAGRAGRAGAPAGVWRDSLTTPRLEPEQVLREQEAALVAQAIAQLVHRQGVACAEIMVLCRKRESLRLAADALRNLGVPYAEVEEQLLMQSREALDLVCVLDVLVSPRHRLSLAQALRSPLFGASDDDLIALATRAGEGRDWWGALMQPDAIQSPALTRAARLLARWRDAARELPPHDLLDRIVDEGALRERVAASVPVALRAVALDAIDALLGQALTLDGARYATPYMFVRALRRRAIKVSAPTQPDAVQLLTVHGAKGLEARVVFVMDSAPGRPPVQTATLLVDWPVDAEMPQRCAFIYSETRCPPSLRDAMAHEVAQREREELNGLYVAMTRARERLVFSATETQQPAPGIAWWDRIEPLALAWPPPVAADPMAATTDAPRSVRLQVLPDLGRREAPEAAAVDVGSEAESARLGRAVHRLLEWAGRPGAAMRPAEIDAWAIAAAHEFGARAGEVARIARRVLASPACARFFAGPALRWAGNEVPVGEAGEALRIDRLVLIDDGGGAVWWVLDYKLRHAPETLVEYRDQLRRYRAA